MKRTVIAATLAVALAGPAAAEPGPVGRWLMDQPVTLWDRGMDRALAEVERAVGAVHAAGFTTNSPGRYVEYHWDNNEIVLSLLVFEDRGPITHERCNELRRGFVRALVYGRATTAKPHKFNAQTKGFLVDAINRWFSHSGYRMKDRDEKLGEKMARIIFAEVHLGGPWSERDGKRSRESIQCRARILEGSAASKPSG